VFLKAKAAYGDRQKAKVRVYITCGGGQGRGRRPTWKYSKKSVKRDKCERIKDHDKRKNPEKNQELKRKRCKKQNKAVRPNQGTKLSMEFQREKG